jgi:hypothetical protein
MTVKHHLDEKIVPLHIGTKGCIHRKCVMRNEVANLLHHWVPCGGYHELPDLSLRRSSLLHGGLWWALSFWWVLRVPRRMAAKWWRRNFWRTRLDGNGRSWHGGKGRGFCGTLTDPKVIFGGGVIFCWGSQESRGLGEFLEGVRLGGCVFF